MSRLPPSMQAEAIMSKARKQKLVKLLDSFDWQANGYSDKNTWMQDMYGMGHPADLLEKCQQQFEKEGLL